MVLASAGVGIKGPAQMYLVDAWDSQALRMQHGRGGGLLPQLPVASAPEGRAFHLLLCRRVSSLAPSSCLSALRECSSFCFCLCSRTSVARLAWLGLHG